MKLTKSPAVGHLAECGGEKAWRVATQKEATGPLYRLTTTHLLSMYIFTAASRGPLRANDVQMGTSLRFKLYFYYTKNNLARMQQYIF